MTNSRDFWLPTYHVCRLKMQNDLMGKGQAKVKLNINTLKLVTGNQTLLEDHHAHTTKLS